MEPFGMNEPDTPFDITDPGHRQTKDFLECCKLSNYLPAFIAEGFDTLSSIYEITESDMVDMQIKRGHRRVIQREIASAKGVPRNQPLDINPLRSIDSPVVICPTPMMGTNGILRDHRMNACRSKTESPVHSRSIGSSINGGSTSASASASSSTNGSCTRFSHNPHTSGYGSMSSTVPSSVDTVSSTQRVPRKSNPSIRSNSFSSNDEESTDTHSNQPKRKYRRHPKSDNNAPIKPPSAYIMFSNNARAQLKDQNMSFATIAKLVGDQWKNLSHEEKQSYERTAMQAKDEYISALERYRQTPEYKVYQAYLKKFTLNQEGNNRQIGRARQRTKQGSTSSMVDSSSSRDLPRNNTSPGGSADADAESSKSSSNSPQETHTNNHMSLPGMTRSTKRRRAESPKNSKHMYETLMSTNSFTHTKTSPSERRRSRASCSSPQENSEPYPSQQQVSNRRFSPRRSNQQAKSNRPYYNTRHRTNRSSEDDSKDLSNVQNSPTMISNSFGSDDASYDMTETRPMKWSSQK
ncbi:hypothetical protein CLU79DRAFT_730070 [Phycomyces nitens]|nr:hypothetical protein CLU79DRAFT_730070 [Phycomyces nitens]